MQAKPISDHTKRANFIRLLRKIHGWLGLWGAILGLLFGISGFILNHRAVLKIPAVKLEASEIQLKVLQPQPSSTEELALFIQKSLNIQHEPVPEKPANGKGSEKGSGKVARVKFLDAELPQPQAWQVVFQLPQAKIQAEYIAGNQYATVKREDANVWGFITRMHKGVGASPAWVLLADSIAGAIIILSITGVLLWTKMRGSRLVMTGLMTGSLVLTVWFTLAMM
ncbi:PepSY-associated TM helix domain-containing protein [Methylotenera mobilis]|uniref:PepSY-associated TM helix domain protein n=1 Tax=Methylotenera mobilis (strain JLW8 / ATCC BAA-1282 / DSM 17540) TaxID=583345 RepID=C6WY96_METML|nr:PepSY-associated TM helix domain-containing protein [Methylotenera mobilis]ACT48815.1 PepSY-associated TM helix domain protein [Methylotenera mobilis JLW8]